MARERLSPEALALIYLRLEHGWLQKELAAHKGLADYRAISRYESGEKALSRETLDDLAQRLGHSRETVDLLLFVHSLISPAAPSPDSPLELTEAESSDIDRAAIAAGWSTAADVRARLTARKKNEKVKAARRRASELWGRLKTCSPQRRRELAEHSSEFQGWALAERVCHESERAAADKPREALGLADLALAIARRVGGEEGWRRRVEGYAWAHVANARRVSNDFAGADQAFSTAWSLWRAGTGAEPGGFPEWRLLDLEASLRREQHRFGEALELLAHAAGLARNDPPAVGRILLKKEFVCEQMGDLEGALDAAVEAIPFVEASGDLHLLFILHFATTRNLCALGRHPEAAALLPRVHELAERLGHEMDLVRVVWLAARIAAGQGRREEAVAGLEQVRREFTVRRLPYDAARAGLELAVLYLEDGRAPAVKALAREMAPIFQAQGIVREAFAALFLFLDAARQETATVELARRAIAELEEARRSHARAARGRK